MSKKMKEQETEEDMSEVEKQKIEQKFKNWATKMQAQYKDEERDADSQRKNDFENLFNNVTREFMSKYPEYKQQKGEEQTEEAQLKELEEAFGMLKNTMEDKYNENEDEKEEEHEEEEERRQHR